MTTIYGLVMMLVYVMGGHQFLMWENNEDGILGTWRNEDETLEVEIYRIYDEYRAKIIWFDDSRDKSQPMSTRCDYNNPNPSLRTRKVLGLEIMNGLRYSSKSQQWSGGSIYDPSSGKYWQAKVWLSSPTTLRVRGFWHLEFIGKNLGFYKRE